MKNQLMLFENKEFGNVRGALINGESWLVGKDIVEALGYKLDDKTTAIKYIKRYCDEDDYILLDKNSLPNWTEVFDYKELGQRGGYLVNESGFYSLVFGSKLEIAKKFKKWVTSEVLPSIRKDGGYISDKATEEQVSNLIDKYSFRKIGQIIHDTNILSLESKIAEIYDANLKLKPKERDKFHSKMNKTEYKIHLKEYIRKQIENRPMPTNGVDSSVEAVIRYSIIEKLDKELLTTTRKSTSKKIAHREKEINKLKNKLEKVVISDDKFIEISYHGLSNNLLYTNKDNKVVRTYQYNKWIDNFPKSDIPPKEYWSEVDFTKPIKLYLKFTIANENIDVNNLCKSTIDMIFNRVYKIDDNIVKDTVCSLDGYCNTYKEGKIKMYIQNV